MRNKKNILISTLSSFLLFSCSTFHPTDFDKQNMALAHSLFEKNITAIRTEMVCPTETLSHDNCREIRNTNVYFESWSLYQDTHNLYIKVKTDDGTVGYIRAEAANRIKYDSMYSPTPIDSSDISEGCVGNKLDYCLSQFRKFMYNEWQDYEIKNQMEKNLMPDINGKLKPGDMSIFFMGGIKGIGNITDSTHIKIYYNRDNIVTSMTIGTNIIKELLRTFDDYSKSGLAEIIWTMVGQKCPDTNPNKLYPFFENNVKNKAFRPYDGGNNVIARSKYPQNLDYGANFCGKKLAFHNFSGRDDSLTTWDNPHGYIAAYEIQVTQ